MQMQSSPFAGSSVGADFKPGKTLTDTVLPRPFVIRIDPLKPFNFYLSDRSCIRYVDTGTETASVRLVAGGEKEGWSLDGPASDAQFDYISGLVCTTSGDRLFVSELVNGWIRSIDHIRKPNSTSAHPIDVHDHLCDTDAVESVGSGEHVIGSIDCKLSVHPFVVSVRSKLREI